MRLFRNRLEAAHELARHLSFVRQEDPIVLGLYRGGVPIAEIIAKALSAPLDVLLIDRLLSPQPPHHVVGAVDEHGRISMIKSTARWHHLTSQQMVGPAREVFRELERTRDRVRAIMPELDVRQRTVILTSQGVATGAKVLGAISSVRDRGASKVIVTAPAGSGEAAWQLQEAADLVVIPHRPTRFKGIEHFYQEFVPVTEEEVQATLEHWVRRRPQQARGVRTLLMDVTNDAGHRLTCEIDLPPGATRGSGPYPAVIFAHGVESDGRNPRSVPISRRLAKRDVIGVRPDFSGHGRSEGTVEQGDERRMYDDLKTVFNQVTQLAEVDSTAVGLVGSGTGSILAMNLAHENPAMKAVVVRGPMSGHEIEIAAHVQPPTLLIYAEQETEFAAQSRKNGQSLPSHHRILEIPDASRLYADAISRELMVGASVDWLVDHLVQIGAPDETDHAIPPPA